MKFKLRYITIASLMAFFLSFQVEAGNSYLLKYRQEVTELFAQIKPEEMWNNLVILSDTQIFPDRSSVHQSGVKAQKWIEDKLNAMIKDSNRKDLSLYTIKTDTVDDNGHPVNFDQSSIILKIGASNQPGIIVGAHFDTVACSSGKDGNYDDEGCLKDPYGPLPGADDDGSGTVAVLEMARTLLSSNKQFEKPIYLIWYAAEEKGELGSRSVVAQFKKNNISVDAVMQLDQIGYEKDNDPSLWIFSGDTHDADLVKFQQDLIHNYINRPVKLSPRNGDSDDIEWYLQNYKTARPVENDVQSPYTHSPMDTIDKISLEHMTDYLKLAIAFAVELARPIQN